MASATSRVRESPVVREDILVNLAAFGRARLLPRAADESLSPRRHIRPLIVRDHHEQDANHGRADQRAQHTKCGQYRNHCRLGTPPAVRRNLTNVGNVLRERAGPASCVGCQQLPYGVRTEGADPLVAGNRADDADHGVAGDRQAPRQLSATTVARWASRYRTMGQTL